MTKGAPHDTADDIRTGPPLRNTLVRKELLWKGPGRSTRPVDLASSLALVVGGLLIVWSSGIHFHLWQSVGYKHIPTIGPLFLLQSIAGLLLGLLVLAVRRVWVAVLGIGFGLATMAGFLISVAHGLFGFKDSWDAPFAHQAFAIEIAIIVVLMIAGAFCLAGSASSTTTRTSPVGTTS
jgi:hypothetical protein